MILDRQNNYARLNNVTKCFNILAISWNILIILMIILMIQQNYYLRSVSN